MLGPLVLALYTAFASFNSTLLSHRLLVDGRFYYEILDSAQNLSSVIESVPGGWGTFLFYYPLVKLGWAAVVSFNMVVVIVISRLLGIHSVLLFSLVPFYLISSLLPSKDLLVLLFLVAYLRAHLRNQILSAIVFLVLLTSVREAFGAVVAASTLFAHFIVSSKRGIGPVLMWFAFLALILAFASIDSEDNVILSQVNFTLDKLSDIAEQEAVQAPYAVRVVTNAIGLGLRPKLFAIDGSLSISGVFHYVSGLFSIFACLCLMLCGNIGRASENPRRIAWTRWFFVSVLFLISISPLPQPRYFVPVIFALYMETRRDLARPLRQIAGAITVVIATCGILALALYPLPNTERDSLTVPEFVGSFTRESR